MGKRNLSLTENRLSRNEMRCESDNHNNMSHVQKNFKIRTLIK